ncbi:hypothetical protein PBY51_017331 [Eleginops maclovinus]|uniref:Apolipoprotein C-I n=1 Tax=Eleginops maclovinus TaxID=56733 RepID=A0AAN7XJG1_ELEMC|nr:hypothetical protein PBY51_017331 [Eleginops maclovinus]
MRVYLVVAMLVLALAAFTVAQEQEEAVEQKFADFTSQMSEMGKNLAEKAKTTFEDIKNSDFVANSQSWFDRNLELMKQKLAEIGQ